MITEDKDYLLGLAQGLDDAERFGQSEDAPEGTCYVQLSDTLAKMIASTLREIVGRPTSGLSDALQECNRAAKAIANLKPHQWAGFVLLVLEALDDELVDDTTYRNVLVQIKKDINVRLDSGRW